MSVTEVVLGVIFSILVVVNLVGNTLVCLVVFRNKSLRVPMNYLLVNLAIADMSFAGFCIPTVYCPSIFSSSWASGRWLSLQGSYWWELELGGNFRLHFGANCLRPLLLSFVSIRKKRSYDASESKTWNCNQLDDCCDIWDPCDTSDEVRHRPKNLSWRLAQYWFCQSIHLSDSVLRLHTAVYFMASVYSKVIYRLWRGSNHAGTHLALLKRRKKVTKLLLIITALHGVCLFPDTVTYVLSYFGFQYGSIAYKVGTVLVCVNSTVNPFLHSLQSERFRRSLRQLLQCCEKCLVVRCWERRDVIVVNDIQQGNTLSDLYSYLS